MKYPKLEEKIELAEGVQATYTGTELVLKGPMGEIKKKLVHPKINITVNGQELVLNVINGTKREKMMLKTFTSHAKNLVKGVSEGFIYKLKICSGHFPMNVSVSNNKFSVKNYFGEKIPRVIDLKKGAEVKVDGDFVIIEGPSKEVAGQIAGDIEQLMRITNRDRRIFQDGIWIVSKAGKNMR